MDAIDRLLISLGDCSKKHMFNNQIFPQSYILMMIQLSRIILTKATSYVISDQNSKALPEIKEEAISQNIRPV